MKGLPTPYQIRELEKKFGAKHTAKFLEYLIIDHNAWIEHQEKKMPIIQFNEKDLLRGKVLPPGWYRVRIDSIGEAPSKDGGSTNYPVEGTVKFNADNGDTEYANVPLDWNFNSKAIGFAVGFLQSFGVNVTPGARFDLNSAAGKETDVYVENGEYQGRIVNRVNHKYRVPREVANSVA